MLPPAVPADSSSLTHGLTHAMSESVSPGAHGQTASRWKGDFPTPESSASGPPPRETVGDTVAEPPPWLARWRLSESPPWLVSMIVHLLLVILLALVPIAKLGGSRLALVLTLDESTTDSVDPETITISPAEQTSQASSAQSELVVLPSLGEAAALPVASPLASSSNVDNQTALRDLLQGEVASAERWLQLPRGGMHRRDPASRTQLGQRYGATPESESAVEAALEWLAKHQRTDGSWSFDLTQAPCLGNCRHSGDESPVPRPATAATGLALLAYLGAGYTHHEGKYADQVRRGLYYLREAAQPSQFGLDLQSGSMYGHGIAAMAVAEAMAMTAYQGRTDTDLFALTEGAANFTMAAQHEQGGWRYVPGSPGDMTVSSWQILSLISAQHSGVALRTLTLRDADRFVRSLSKPGVYAFGYQSTKAEPTTTAIGLCMLMYLGQSPQPTPFAKALDEVVLRGPKRTDVYHDYYATLALHHARHREWEAWHVPLRDHLVRTQATKGHEAGSWHFSDRHGDVGGRLYTTAMAAMILEVYYRYLPLYQSNDEFRLD